MFKIPISFKIISKILGSNHLQLRNEMGRSDGAMVLGKFPVPRRPANLN